MSVSRAKGAIAKYKKALGDPVDSQRFVNRAQDWKNLLNPKDGYLEPRYSNGSFPSPYHPTSEMGWVESDGDLFARCLQRGFDEVLALGGDGRSVPASFTPDTDEPKPPSPNGSSAQ